MKETVAQTIAQELRVAGVRYVFGHPGGEVVDLIYALEKSGVQFVLMGHEAAAAFAAGVWGQATGVPGVCLATLGPGACNLTIGIADALLDRHPLIAITARTSSQHADWLSHQQLALNDMFAPISKASIALDGRETGGALRRALQLANTPPRGPVYLSLPADLAAQPDSGQPAETGMPADVPLPNADPRALATIQSALDHARRPVAVVGIALDQLRHAQPVRDFLKRTGIPYADTPKTKGLVDPASALYLGTCVSSSGDALIAEFLGQSDCLLGIGFDPIETTYEWHRSQHYYSLTNAPTDFGSYHPHVEAIGDIQLILRQLAQDYAGSSAWSSEEIAQLRGQVQRMITPQVARTEIGLAPYHVARVLGAALPAGTRLSLDTGSHKMLFAQAWRTATPLSYFNSNGLSSMGTGVPGAISLALLHPEHTAVCVTGDGGFGMMVEELETVLRLGLRPLFVVLCDRALSLIRLPYRMRGYAPIGVDLAPVDWARVAEGFGVRGVWARTLDELDDSLVAWRGEPQATVLAVQIDDALYCGNSY